MEPSNSTYPTPQSAFQIDRGSPLGRIITQIRTDDPSLSKASLFNKGIGDDGAIEVAAALRSNTNLRLLDVGRNDIREEGCSALASALQENRTLRMLWLRDNKAGPRGAAAIADAISQNQGLTGLSLGRNNLTPGGVSDIASALRANTTLKALWLYGNSMSDLGAESLADALKVNTSLNELCLGSNGITEGGARALAYTLLQNSSLTSLELNRNQVGSAGAQALASALQSNSTLTELSLRRNGIRYEGVQALINAALGDESTLLKLDLRDNAMTQEEIVMAEGEVARLTEVLHSARRSPCTVILRTEPSNSAYRPTLQGAAAGPQGVSYMDRSLSRGPTNKRAQGDIDLENGRAAAPQEQRALLRDTAPPVKPLEVMDKEDDNDDDDDMHELYDDVYSMLFLSKFPSISFFFAVSTFALKTLLFTFVTLDIFSGGYPGNYLNIPGGVSALVRCAQFFMIPVAVAMQEDLISSMALVNVHYTTDITNDYPGATFRKWILASSCRLIDGLYSLTINFCILVQASNVLGMFLNFAALHFLGSVDNVAFQLSLDGYFGDHLENTAEAATVTKLPEETDGWLRSFDTIAFLVVYLACLVAWIILTIMQLNGDFLCESFNADFGSQTWGNVELENFSGTYVQLGNRKERINRRAVHVEDTERGTKGAFAYCESDKVWGFVIAENEEQIDPCEYILYSSDAQDNFDVTAVSQWFYRSLIDETGTLASDFSIQCTDPN